MGKLYKLTKGTVSVIRTSKEAVQEALAAGYAMDGEVAEENGQYRVINPAPIFDEAPAPAPAPPSDPKGKTKDKVKG